MATRKSMKKILLIVLMVIGLASLLSLPALAAPKWQIPDGIKTIEVNGYDMAYQETGSGIPLVLIHAASSDYRTWNANTRDFSKAYRTFAVSLRHYYPEKWNGVGNDFSVTQHASDVAALIKSLNLGKVHLLGWSRGGAVALNLAIRYPEVIRTLILAEASMESLLPDTPERQKSAANERAFINEIQAILAKGDFEEAARMFVDKRVGPGTWERMPAKGKQLTLDNIGTVVETAERPKISCADAQKLNFPVLLLNGERSQKVYHMMNAAMRQCKPDISAPLIVPNSTHRMHIDNPQFFNKNILDFLNQH